MHLYTADKSVKALLRELINLTNEIKSIQEQAMDLTIEFRKKKEV